MSVDSQSLRSVMRRVASPVVVVTMAGRQEARGMTASSFTSVSLAPPLVSVSIDLSSRTHILMLESDYFVINLLADDQGHLSDLFAEPGLTGAEQMQRVPHRLLLERIPVLENTLGWLLCRRHNPIAGGDHSIFLGEVQEVELGRAGHPLIFYARGYYRVGEIATDS